MSLINCVECGQQISDTVKKCPYCGFKMKKKMSKKKKTIMIVSSVLSVMLALSIIMVFIIFNIVIPSNKYSKAENYLKAEKYEEAIKIFEELDEFKDAESRVKESNYKYGEYLVGKGKYDEAINAFENAEDYSNANERINDVKAKKQELEEMEKLLANKELLKEAYNSCDDDGTSLSSDGLSIRVDSSGDYDYTSLLDVYTIVEKLRLPDSLIDAMLATNSLMGRQTETHGSFEISWSYHPNNGLDVIFRIIEK